MTKTEERQSSDMVERLQISVKALDELSNNKRLAVTTRLAILDASDNIVAANEVIEELVAERNALAKRVHDLEGDVSSYRKTMDVMVEDEAARLEAQTKTSSKLGPTP